MRKLLAIGAAVVALYAAGQHAASSAAPGHSSGSLFGRSSLEALWEQGGGSAATASNAACHAMQESSGRSWAISPNRDGGVNVGLWQEDTRGKGAGYTIAQLQDPLTNARIAVAATSDGTNWSAWATPGC